MIGCAVPECLLPAKSRGWCNVHYLRWYTHGDPEWRPPSLEERFWALVDRSGGPEACWPWIGFIEKEGYGRVNRGGPKWAHRVVYEMERGPIPARCDVDHTCHGPECTDADVACRHRRCVNPIHLKAATRRENTARSRRRARGRAA